MLLVVQRTGHAKALDLADSVNAIERTVDSCAQVRAATDDRIQGGNKRRQSRTTLPRGHAVVVASFTATTFPASQSIQNLNQPRVCLSSVGADALRYFRTLSRHLGCDGRPPCLTLSPCVAHDTFVSRHYLNEMQIAIVTSESRHHFPNTSRRERVCNHFRFHCNKQ